MTATLTFTLPGEEAEFSAAVQGGAVRGAVQELDNWLRAELKYGDPPEARAAALQEARDKLHALLEDAGVRLWE